MDHVKLLEKGESTETHVKPPEEVLKDGDSGKKMDHVKLLEQLLKDGAGRWSDLVGVDNDAFENISPKLTSVVEDYILTPDRAPRINEALVLADLVAIPGNGFGIAVCSCVTDWLLRIFYDFSTDYGVGDQVMTRMIWLEMRVYGDPVLTEPSTLSDQCRMVEFEVTIAAYWHHVQAASPRTPTLIPPTFWRCTDYLASPFHPNSIARSAMITHWTTTLA
ncbi:hypothetical protein SARC_06940 [Sphaeroforma arctica JP610]|uniref:Uncharacterized protein n=1 Tax=Sphaeroforma arctica JP610 TaxID=667725 RepID=A0A0L0FVV9_9EUKA|nr:hypothetical protein SARC_06940 [Sphaeroforma arctica JP610]KNC80691.1 hypothetical protein SARC_06940 [Sphaeroforma arctica JP610]|eukprot:XP_014154593.1 hypothetical protein SARC_06940 [Sphaeroforma arctica JP610]